MPSSLLSKNALMCSSVDDGVLVPVRDVDRPGLRMRELRYGHRCAFGIGPYGIALLEIVEVVLAAHAAAHDDGTKTWPWAGSSVT